MILEDANKKYMRIYAFKDMFYEFLSNSNNVDYISSVLLLKKVIEDNYEEGKVIEKVVSSWDMADRNITFNPGRINIKRFLALLYNKELRMEVFGF